jgi:hypothetical protein
MHSFKMAKSEKELGDVVGVLTSSLCLIHCFGVLLLAPLLPILHVKDNYEVFHLLLAPLVIGIAGRCLSTGYKKHRSIFPLLVAGTAALFLIGDLVLEAYPLILPALQAKEHGLTIIASILFIASHIGNAWLLRQRHSTCYKEELIGKTKDSACCETAHA